VLAARTLTEKGPGRDTRWPTRAMAAETGLSQSSVSRIWRAFGLKPHLAGTWKLSGDPEFSAKVRDVAGLHMSPPEHALVLAVGEKSQIQAPDRTAPCLPILPATPERRTRDYARNGTASLFAACDLASGPVIARHYRRHRHQEFAGSSRSSTPPCPRAGPAPGPGQLRPQDSRHQGAAGQAPPLPPALHAGQLIAAQPGRAVVLGAGHPQAAAVRPPRRHRARGRRPPADQRVEQEPEAIRAGQVR
jgi:hypothetical protein